MVSPTRVLIGLLVCAAVGSPAAAQEAEPPTPGVSAVRSFECGLGNLDEAVALLNGEWREIARGLVDEGRLLDYGILTHAWGDEWNLLDYYVAEDIESFHAAFGELVTRLQRRDPEGELFDEFAELCPRHKDNIYSVVPPDR